MATKIIEQQLRQLRAECSTSFTVQPIVCTNDGGFHLKARIKGPTHSPYAGGVFIVNIHISVDYPFKPPKVYFETKIYHPNVGDSSDHRMSLDILYHWKPDTTISKILHSICSALEEPDKNFPYATCNDQTARDWTIKYAME